MKDIDPPKVQRIVHKCLFPLRSYVQRPTLLNVDPLTTTDRDWGVAVTFQIGMNDATSTNNGEKAHAQSKATLSVWTKNDVQSAWWNRRVLCDEEMCMLLPM